MRLASLGLALLCTSVVSLSATAQFPPEIRGRVVDRSSGAGLAGATITVAGGTRRVMTDADGRFVLRGLVPGERELTVRAFGYLPIQVSTHVANGRVEHLVVALDPLPALLEPMVIEGTQTGQVVGLTELDRFTIERSGARDLGDLLDGIPGLTVIRRGGPGSPAVAAMRGGQGDDVLVLLDGVSINSPLTGEADLSTVGTQSLERVRVLRGAQSARYGGRAMTGVIVVETRTSAAPELGLSVGRGGLGEQSAAFHAGGSTGKGRGLSANVGGEWRTVDGDFAYAVPEVRGGGRAVRENADASLLNLSGTGVWQGSRVRLAGHLDGFAASRGMPGSVVQPSLGGRQTQRRLAGGLSVEGFAGEWLVFGRMDGQVQHAAFRDSSPPGGAPFHARTRVTSWQTELGTEVRVGRFSIVSGTDVRGRWFDASTLTADAPTAQTEWGSWLSLRTGWVLSDGWVAEVSSGARVDWNSLVPTLVLSPRVSASLGGRRISLRLSVGSAFSPPSLADQFFHEGVFAQPNPELRPERVRAEVQGELGWSDVPLLGARVSGRLSGYVADVNGMILWFPDFRFVWRPDNFDVRRRGVELETTIRLPVVGGELRGSFGQSLVEYEGPVLSGQVVYRPVTSARIEAAATIAGLRSGVRGRYTGRRRTVAGSRLNTLPDYWVVDLQFDRPIRFGGWSTDLSFRIDNVFNESAFLLVDFPGPGRTWRVGLRLRTGGSPPRGGSSDHSISR